METKEIIAQIDAEIVRLQEVKSILSGTVVNASKRGPKKSQAAPTPITNSRRQISAAGRARIAAAQKARWAKAKKATKAA